MKIDGHAHSAGEFLDADDLIHVIDSLGVDKVVLCPGVKNDDRTQSLPRLSRFPKGDHMLKVNRIIWMVSHISRIKGAAEIGNEYVHLQYRKYPNRIIQFYWVDPFQKDISLELENAYDLYGFRGLKLHQCFQHFRIDPEIMGPILGFARRERLPIFIHVYSKKEVEKLIKIIRKNDENNFVIGHLIGLELYLRKCRDLRNIHFDISPNPLISEYRILKAIETFGADRVIMGSDTPYGKNNLGGILDKIRALNITKEEKDLIMGNNMKAMLLM